jgi:hypothetical protein
MLSEANPNYHHGVASSVSFVYEEERKPSVLALVEEGIRHNNRGAYL